MIDPRLILLDIYYRASCPYRWWWHHRAAAARREPVVVLFYHRIADDRANPWTTSNCSFARQIDWLARRFQLVSLEEAQRRIRAGNERPCASITFDDGYAENCRAAIPLLIRRKIPCTYFVTLRNVLDGEPFPHDVDRGDRFHPNDLDQLRAMADAGIEIGAHTRTHPDLAQVTGEARLHDEVVASGRELEALVGRRVRYFAFPFGQYANLTSRAFQVAREARYEAVCSAYGGYNYPGDDPFHLQRIHVDEGMTRLRNRATVDPRKVRTLRFSYEMSETVQPQAAAEPRSVLAGMGEGD